VINILELNKLHHGECLQVLKSLPDSSVDSIVTDPPYELGFMGKSWDSTGIAYNVELWKECLRVLKAGGHLLSFGGTRTYHRMACAIEDAGFEIRDQIQWIYGSGFPKSHNINKAINKKLEYTSEQATQWEGWGTALKPAHEPIVMARKPLSEKTIVDNVLKWGTGGINIDESRVAYQNEADLNTVKAKCNFTENSKSIGFGTDSTLYGTGITPLEQARDCVKTEGRFPANIIFDEDAGKILDEQSGITKSGKVKENKDAYSGESVTGFLRGVSNSSNQHGDSGGASRFFYCAKAAKKEKGEFNSHPTVKPIMLMEYLVKLVTPKNGIVLDPFAGSGSTLVAAKMNEFNYIGIEMEEDYAIIINKRLEEIF
jgi:site-specific DNA-methyltransferase (adenine-specific)